MCGNRVEELETRVQELEASVEGLTDELVECKVRIRELENTVDEESGFSRSDAEAETTSEAEPNSGSTEETENEIITPGADTPNTEDAEEGDTTTAEPESESEEDSTTDIIVA